MEKIQAYLSPYNIKLITAFAFINNKSKSKVGGEIIKTFLDNLSEEDVKKLLIIHENLSEKQKKFPSNYFNL